MAAVLQPDAILDHAGRSVARSRATFTIATLFPAFLGLLAVIVGCGAPATIVEGCVTLDGKPIDKAVVQFTPERRDAATDATVTDGEGRYRTTLAPVPFVVTIVAQRVVGKKKDDANPNGAMVDIVEDVVPARYADPARSSLRVEPVKGSRTVADFPLSAQP